MRRGTTPTLQITVTGLPEIEIQNLYLTLEQQGVVIEKNGGRRFHRQRGHIGDVNAGGNAIPDGQDGCCHAAACTVYEQYRLRQQHRYRAGRGDTEGGSDTGWWN